MKNYNHVDEKYLDLIEEVLENGISKDDRTKVGTISSFGHFMKFDLSKGFPILTTKKVNFDNIVQELLFFINGIDNFNLLKSKGVNIWNNWGDKNGNLGAMYGQQLRNFGGKHNNRVQPKNATKLSFTLLYDGQTKHQSMYGEYFILSEESDSLNIQFFSTGYTTKIKRSQLLNRKIYDPFYPSFCGVGFMGLGHEGYKQYEWYYKILTKWKILIQRCYNDKKDNYKYYGGKGVKINERWHNFSNFIKDIQYLDGWDNLTINDELDKDILGDSFEYSYNKCKWVTRIENMYSNKIKYTIKNNINGAYASFTNANQFMRTNNINNQGNFSSMLRGERPSAEGWSFIDKEELEKGIDQLSDIILSLKNDPFSRRHVITLWNPLDLKSQALACCHGTVIQFNVLEKESKKYLSCSMYQRSADLFLGVPYNISSYALLTHLVAHYCGYEVGELNWIGGDCHIYSNHVDQVKLQLSRYDKMKGLPTLYLNPNKKDFFSFGLDDISLIGYEYESYIKAPIAI